MPAVLDVQLDGTVLNFRGFSCLATVEKKKQRHRHWAVRHLKPKVSELPCCELQLDVGVIRLGIIES